MKDMRGKEIKIGDTVVCAKTASGSRGTRSPGLVFAKVIRFTPQMVVTGASRKHRPGDLLIWEEKEHRQYIDKQPIPKGAKRATECPVIEAYRQSTKDDLE